MDALARMATLPYGSEALLDAVECAMDDGIDGWEIDFTLDAIHERHWEAISGPPDVRRAWWPKPQGIWSDCPA
jgi:hypothetical protein